MKKEKQKNDEVKDERNHLRLVFLAIILFWVLNLYFMPYLFGEPQDAGGFGDMFGAVNALFSGLAFWGVIYAILLQREELKLQREELSMTRKEIAKQSEALEGQLTIMREERKSSKQKEAEGRIRIKPKFQWKCAGKIGSSDSQVFALEAQDREDLCPEATLEFIDGGQNFIGHFLLYRGMVFDGPGGAGGPAHNNADVEAWIKVDGVLRFRFNYSDSEGHWYSEIVSFFEKDEQFTVEEGDKVENSKK